MRRLSLFLLLLIVVPVARAASLPPLLERLLLPVTVNDAPGAFGTRWRSRMQVRMEPRPFVYPLFAGGLACDPPCPEPMGIDEHESFPADVYPTRAGQTPGQFLYVDAAAADDVHISLILSETSGLYRLVPIQLPVVRQREFTQAAINILGLPMRADLRSLLRIYSNDPTALGNVRVRAVSEDPLTSGAVLYDGSVPLYVVQVQGFGPYSFDLRPPVAQLPLSDIIGTRAQSVRLEITPDTPGLKLWAFVSITDNATQAISIRTPN